MPKEYINNRYYGQHATDHNRCPGRDEPEGCPGDSTCVGERVALDDSAVKVGWTKDRDHVEIGVAHHRDGTDFGDTDWVSQLDRDSINRLIRTLRKARDQAFGADA